jgi:hypothetical protein
MLSSKTPKVFLGPTHFLSNEDWVKVESDRGSEGKVLYFYMP